MAVVTKRAQFILNEIIKKGDDIQLNNLADLDEVLSSLLILDKEKLQSAPTLNYFELIFRNNFVCPKVYEYLYYYFVYKINFFFTGLVGCHVYN